MINPQFFSSPEIETSQRTENLLQAIKNTSLSDNDHFYIVVHEKSTKSLLKISIPTHAIQTKERIPKLSSINQHPTLPWAKRIIDFSARKMEDQALREISEITTKLKNTHEERKISEGLSQLLKHDLMDIISIALLRNTFSFRHNIPSWEEFLRKTEKKLVENNEDPKKHLRGLKVNFE